MYLDPFPLHVFPDFAPPQPPRQSATPQIQEQTAVARKREEYLSTFDESPSSPNRGPSPIPVEVLGELWTAQKAIRAELREPEAAVLRNWRREFELAERRLRNDNTDRWEGSPRAMDIDFRSARKWSEGPLNNIASSVSASPPQLLRLFDETEAAESPYGRKELRIPVASNSATYISNNVCCPCCFHIFSAAEHQVQYLRRSDEREFSI